MSQLSEQTLYEILEVSSDASQEEIHKAFHRAKNTYSPNSPALYSVFSKEEAEELLRLIDEAYSVLSNQVKRKDYDLSLKNQTFHPSGPASSHQSFSVIPGGVGMESSADSNAFAIPEADVVAFPETTSSRRNTPAPEPAPSSRTPYAQSSVTSANSPRSSSTSAALGRTRFSHYDVNPYFEEEIKNQEVFDGTFLQKVRQYKGISLDQISEFTRIGRQYLSAVESNDFGSLPAPVFIRGFLVQIARALGLDDKKVADSYMKLLKDSRG